MEMRSVFCHIVDMDFMLRVLISELDLTLRFHRVERLR